MNKFEQWLEEIFRNLDVTAKSEHNRGYKMAIHSVKYRYYQFKNEEEKEFKLSSNQDSYNRGWNDCNNEKPSMAELEDHYKKGWFDCDMAHIERSKQLDKSVEKVFIPYKYQFINKTNSIWRAKVIGGWIVSEQHEDFFNNIFIPDEHHQWEIE